MSGSNAISGITIVGALIAAGAVGGLVGTVLGTLAVALRDDQRRRRLRRHRPDAGDVQEKGAAEEIAAMGTLIDLAYIVAAILFILGLKMLGSPATARRGNIISAVGMLLAIAATLLHRGLDFRWIIVGIVVGSAIGAIAAQRVQMTAMPEMVALFNGVGGLASLLVGWAEYHAHPRQPARCHRSPSCSRS